MNLNIGQAGGLCQGGRAGFKDYAIGLPAQSGCTDMMRLAVLIKN